MDTSAINRRLAHLNRWVTGAEIPEDPERGLRGKAGQGHLIARIRKYFTEVEGAEWTLQIGADTTATQAPSAHSHGGGYTFTQSGRRGTYKHGDDVAPNPPATEAGSTGIAANTRPVNRSTLKHVYGYLARGRAERIAEGLNTVRKEIAKAIGLQAERAQASATPAIVRPARNVGDFTARLQDAFAGCNASDIRALNTKLSRVKGLMPDCGYQFALSMLEALSEGCNGNAVLAGKVLDEMERIRVRSNGDDHENHDPAKAATQLLSRMPLWLTLSKTISPKSVPTATDCEQAFFRTAALLSDTRHTPYDYQAFCLATGLVSTRAIREEINSTVSPGAAGPHRLDLGGRDIGKRLVMIGLQALQQDYGDARPDRLASRVVSHVRQLGLMLGNERFMAALPQAEPVDINPIVAAQENIALDAEDRSELTESQGDLEGQMDLTDTPEQRARNDAAAEKDFNLRVLRATHHNEAVARNRRIDIMIGLDESLAGPGMPKGIGKKAFVDLMCWVNGMRTEADIERRGRKHIDGCVKPFLVCDKLAEKPHLKNAGILRHLMVGSSALHTMHSFGDADAARRHGDEDAGDYKKNAGEILDILRERLPAFPSANDTSTQAALLRACRMRYLLMRAAHTVDKNADVRAQQAALLKVITSEGQDLRADNQAQIIDDYCRVFCPSLVDDASRPAPTNLMALVRRHILHNLPTDRINLRAFIDKCPLTQEQHELMQDKLLVLHIIEDGNTMRGPGYTEDICKALQTGAARRQDNSQKSVDGVSGGLPRVSAEIPLTPDGTLKLTIAAQLTGSSGDVMYIANENHGTLIMFGKETGLSKVFTTGLGLSQDIGAAEVTAGVELSRGRETTKLSGCTITILRDIVNNYDNHNEAGGVSDLDLAPDTIDNNDEVEAVHGEGAAGRRPGTLAPGKSELSKREVEHLGLLGEFRAVEINVHEVHALMANNPTGLSPEQLIALQYGEKKHPNIDLPEATKRIRPLDGIHLTEEQRKVLRHPDRERLINEMKGRDYFDNFFMALRYDDHIIRVTETEQNIQTDKYNAAISAKFKSNLAGTVPAELKATFISHTHAKQINHRHDVQGAINFEYLMNTVTESTTRGVSATVTSPDDTIGSDITMAGDGIGYTKRIGYMMERNLVKLLSRDEGGNTFHKNTDTMNTYGGQNFSYSNFDAFERAIKANLAVWADILRGYPLPPPPENETPEEAAERLARQRIADEALIDARLDALRKMPLSQNTQLVLRYRLRASTGVKLDQLKTEIRHTEQTICKTIDAIHDIRRSPLTKAQLNARLESLQKTLYALHDEKLELLGRGENWEAFGFGLADMFARTGVATGKETEKMAPLNANITALSGPVRLTVSASSVQSFMEVNELGWVKADAAYSDYNHRLGRKLDAKAREENYLASLLGETSLQAVVDGIGGAIRAGIPVDRLNDIARHAIDLLRAGPANAEAEAARATLCRHLLTLGNTNLIGQFIDEGHVTLRALLEQAVHSRRIGVVEMLLSNQHDNADIADDPALPPEERTRRTEVRARRNFRTALWDMQPDDRLELLYGLMVRDQRDGRMRNPERLRQRPEYAGTAWQGRTLAVNAVAAQIAQAGQLDRAGVEWLMEAEYVGRNEVRELLLYKPNLRTLDLALQYFSAVTKDDEIFGLLRTLQQHGSRHAKYSSIDAVEFCLHTLNCYRNPLIARRMAENFGFSMAQLCEEALHRGDAAAVRRMFEAGLVDIGHLIADQKVNLSEDRWIDLYRILQSGDFNLDKRGLVLLLKHALEANATRLLAAIGPQLCARVEATDGNAIDIGRVLRRVIECKQSTLDVLADILRRHGRTGDQERPLKEHLDDQKIPRRLRARRPDALPRSGPPQPPGPVRQRRHAHGAMDAAELPHFAALATRRAAS